MRMLSHQMYRHTHQDWPGREETATRYRTYSSRRLLKQAGEIQARLTAELENQVIHEATNPEKYSPMEF